MPTIRVDPEKLRRSADLMLDLSQQAGNLSSRAWELTVNAPSYDGQFGPQVQAIGAEAASRIGALAALLAAREEYLTARAEAFDAADQAVVGSFAAVLPPVPNFTELFGIPQWVLDIIIAMIPGGDAIDILAQLKKWLLGEEVDDLVLALALFGLAMDLGYIDPFPAEEGGTRWRPYSRRSPRGSPKALCATHWLISSRRPSRMLTSWDGSRGPCLTSPAAARCSKPSWRRTPRLSCSFSRRGPMR